MQVILAVELGKEEIKFPLSHSPGWLCWLANHDRDSATKTPVQSPDQVNLLIGYNLFGLLCVVNNSD